jgi:ribonucleoside-diphosphate reductase alpha chain
MANNASNGIEPSFAHQYRRNIIVPGKKTKLAVDVLSYELLHYQAHVEPQTNDKLTPDYFVNAEQISPSAHIAIQAAAQTWIDSSISKTINVASDINFNNFKDIYLQAANQGLKGCTTFRYNPEAFQGVLVNPQEQANTRYRFTLADQSQIELAGDETVLYDGEEHLAANLYEALKEGYYGKH